MELFIKKLCILAFLFIISAHCMESYQDASEFSIDLEEIVETNRQNLGIILTSFNLKLMQKVLKESANSLGDINDEFRIQINCKHSMLKECKRESKREDKGIIKNITTLMNHYFYIVQSHLLQASQYKNRDQTLYQNAVPILRELLIHKSNPDTMVTMIDFPSRITTPLQMTQYISKKTSDNPKAQELCQSIKCLLLEYNAKEIKRPLKS